MKREIIYSSLDTILKLSGDIMNYNDTIPTPDEFIKMIKHTTFLTKYSKSKSTLFNKTNKKSKRTTKKKYTKSIKSKQYGSGYNEIVMSYLKSYTKNILGIVDNSSRCSYIESTLNILCWTAFLYTIIMNSYSQDTTVYNIMEQLSAPNDFILSLLPQTDNIIKKTVASHLSKYCIGIWTDYQKEGFRSVLFSENIHYTIGTITKLIKINKVTYEYLYLRPIICILSSVIEDCKERCYE